MFFTLTYRRDLPIPETWYKITRTFNHYITDLRRFHHDKLQYLRVVEEHQDGYPHIHCIIQFQNVGIRVQDARWFDSSLYKQWKNRWVHGHSDIQCPRGTRTHVLAYVLKYCLKNRTASTVWKKVLLDSNNSQDQDNTDSIQTQSDQDIVNSATSGDHNINDQVGISVPPVKKYGVKYLTWSRNFNFKPFIVENNNKPCPKRDLSTHLTFK